MYAKDRKSLALAMTEHAETRGYQLKRISGSMMLSAMSLEGEKDS